MSKVVVPDLRVGMLRLRRSRERCHASSTAMYGTGSSRHVWRSWTGTTSAAASPVLVPAPCGGAGRWV